MNKKQLNNSLKNSDKNFNENYTHKKEQIIVDGVDVSECKEYIWALSHVCNLVNGKTDKFQCNYYPNCYFKQLKRKTQECEEVKEYARRQENQKEAYYKELLKRVKALKEIEKVCRADVHTFADGTQVRYDSLDDILNITNKARGRLNEK